MRQLSLVTEYGDPVKQNWPRILKQTGFIDKDKISAVDLVGYAGWELGENLQDIYVLDAVTDQTFFDENFEEDRANARLIGNDDYGLIDGAYESQAFQYPVPRKDECWIFILGCPYYSN